MFNHLSVLFVFEFEAAFFFKAASHNPQLLSSFTKQMTLHEVA